MNLNVIWLLFCFIVSSPLNGATLITLNGNEVAFETRPRLADVLSSVALQQDWYWPASALHRVKNTKLIAIHNDVLLKLENIRENTTNNEKMHNAIGELITEITLWKLAERIQLKIDYDLARINARHNPLFEEESYTLNLIKRPTNLYVFGAIANTETIAHKPASDVSEYVSSMHLIDQTNKDYLYIIQPDGKTMRVAHAYWNKGHQEVMPGSQLYIPFKESLFTSDNQKLNENIIYLAANRILP